MTDLTDTFFIDRLWCKNNHINEFKYKSLHEALSFDLNRSFSTCKECGERFSSIATYILQCSRDNLIKIPKENIYA